MGSKTRMIVGAAFLMVSGLLFTIERLSAKVYWFAQIQTGAYPTFIEPVSLFSNLFVPFFFICGIFLIAMNYKEIFRLKYTELARRGD